MVSVTEGGGKQRRGEGEERDQCGVVRKKEKKEVATCSASFLTFCPRGSVGQTKEAKPHANTNMNMQQRFITRN